MRDPHRVMLLVCLFVVQVSVAGQSPQSTSLPYERDPQALTALKNTLAALGGTLPSDSTATGTVTAVSGSEEQQGTLRILTRGSSQSLEEITLPNSDQITAYCNLMAIQINGSAQTTLSGQIAATSQTSFFPLPLLLGAENDPDFSFQYVALESANGMPAHHLRMWDTFTSKPYARAVAQYSVRDIWIDTASNLPVKISFTQQSVSGSATLILVEVDLSSYQIGSGGFAYPRAITKSINGTKWLSIAIQSVSFNTGLSSSDFPINCTQGGN